jgi:hypothetical protein
VLLLLQLPICHYSSDKQNKKDFLPVNCGRFLCGNTGLQLPALLPIPVIHRGIEAEKQGRQLSLERHG